MVTARQVEIFIRRPGHPERRVPLEPGDLTLGRAEDNDLVLPDIGVSRRHARLHVSDDAVFVEDMGSGNGTWFHGHRISRQLLGDGDEVTIDPFTLRFRVQEPEPAADITDGRDATAQLGANVPFARVTVISAHKMDQKDFTLPTTGTVTLGRSEKNTIVLPEPASSRVHADIACALDNWILRDHGSSNGTFVNARRVKERILADGDRIRIGTVELRFSLVRPAEEGGEHTENFEANLHHPPPPTVPVAAHATHLQVEQNSDGWVAHLPPAPDASSPHLPRLSAAQTAPFVRPTNSFAPPPPPPPAPVPAGVEIDVDASKVKAKRGPRVRAAKSTGFMSRPINQISVGLIALTVILIGGKLTLTAVKAVIGGLSPAETSTVSSSPGRVALAPTESEAVARGMAEGMRLFAEGKQFDAAAQFYKVLQIDPGNVDAKRMGFVACESIAVQTMRASLELRSASVAERAEAKATALAAVATAMERGGGTGLAAAREAVAAALALNPSDPDLVAAEASLDQRHTVIVRTGIREKNERDSATLDRYLADGQREFDRGAYARAVAIWEKVLGADPTRSKPQFYQAEEGIRSAKDKMKSESRKDYQSGLSAMKNGDWLSARSSLERVVRSDPYNEAAAAKLAEVKGHLREQASDYYTEARTLEGINQTEKALALYQKVISYVGDEGDPLAQKAQSRMKALMQ